MLADLDLLLTAVFVTADDLLTESARNAMRRVTDAEVVTLAVAQAMMNIASDRGFLAVAHHRPRGLFHSSPPSRATGSGGTGWRTASSG